MLQRQTALLPTDIQPQLVTQRVLKNKDRPVNGSNNGSNTTEWHAGEHVPWRTSPGGKMNQLRH